MDVRISAGVPCGEGESERGERESRLILPRPFPNDAVEKGSEPQPEPEAEPEIEQTEEGIPPLQAPQLPPQTKMMDTSGKFVASPSSSSTPAAPQATSDGFSSWREFFQICQEASRTPGPLANPVLNMETHHVSIPTLKTTLPWVVTHASVPGVSWREGGWVGRLHPEVELGCGLEGGPQAAAVLRGMEPLRPAL